MGTPESLPLPRAHPAGLNAAAKLVIGFSIIPASIFATLIVLRIFGLACPFSVPTGAMAPTISPGDHVFMEGLTYLHRQPRRGDVVVFKTEGIAQLPQEQNYVKRIAGQPREQLSISSGDLYINGRVVALSNVTGRIVYSLPPFGAPLPTTNTFVPAGCYFVLGDNSTNSFDSRYWGCVPRKNIRGRISFCYWPPQRIGFVR